MPGVHSTIGKDDRGGRKREHSRMGDRETMAAYGVKRLGKPPTCEGTQRAARYHHIEMANPHTDACKQQPSAIRCVQHSNPVNAAYPGVLVWRGYQMSHEDSD